MSIDHATPTHGEITVENRLAFCYRHQAEHYMVIYSLVCERQTYPKLGTHHSVLFVQIECHPESLFFCECHPEICGGKGCFFLIPHNPFKNIGVPK